MDKKACRQEMLRLLEEIPQQVRLQMEANLLKSTLAHPFWQSAQVVGLTIAKHPEVSTLPLLEAAWVAGKVTVVPKCLPATKELAFYRIDSLNQLEVGHFGIQEPIALETEMVSHTMIDCLLVPGLAFNQKKQRLGFGGGYYDRLLADYRGHTLSLAFVEQMRSDWPVEAHDLAVEEIIV